MDFEKRLVLSTMKVFYTDGRVETRYIEKDTWTFAGDNLDEIDYAAFHPGTITGTAAYGLKLGSTVEKVVIDDETVYSKTQNQ
jgi:hypothetical protein